VPKKIKEVCEVRQQRNHAFDPHAIHKQRVLKSLRAAS